MHFIYKILITVLINLCIVNVFILDFIKELDNISLAVYQLHNYYKISNITDLKSYTNSINSIKKNNILCTLNCDDQLEMIIHFYSYKSEFKNKLYIFPVKVNKINNNECRVLYYTKPIINHNDKYHIPANMRKDNRIFKFSYIYINKCNWYITNISQSLWKS